jgi:hypothetical protein
MAHFSGTVRGSRGEASRLGDKESGLRTETNGWRAGVTVIAKTLPDFVVADRGEDEFAIYVTEGSGNPQTKPFGYIGRVNHDGKFTPSEELREQIINEYLTTTSHATREARSFSLHENAVREHYATDPKD